MRMPEPLHPRFRNRPFLVAEATRAGVGRARLRSSDLTSPHRGVRAPRVVAPTLLDRCAAYLAIMPPRSVFSHSTAALLAGVPLPIRIERESALHVAVLPPQRAPRVDGITGHQLDLRASEVMMIRGLRVTTPERTWCDLGAVLSVRELVAAGDFLIGRERPISSREKLSESVARRGRGRGVANLAKALALLNERSESPQESLLRTIFVQAGLPRLDVNIDVRDGCGRFVARPDLRFPDHRLVVEYEGDGHRTDRKQWRDDFGRIARLQVLGEEVLRVGAADVADEARLLAVVRALLARQVRSHWG